MAYFSGKVKEVDPNEEAKQIEEQELKQKYRITNEDDDNPQEIPKYIQVGNNRKSPHNQNQSKENFDANNNFVPNISKFV